jgi:hypothetical protein
MKTGNQNIREENQPAIFPNAKHATTPLSKVQKIRGEWIWMSGKTCGHSPTGNLVHIMVNNETYLKASPVH